MWLLQFTILLLIATFAVNGDLLSQEINNSTEFSFDFYRSYHNLDESQVLSPISLRIMLSILYQSAHHETAAQLAEKLYFPNDKSQCRQLITSNFNENLIKSENIKILNKIFLSNSRTLRDEFINSVADYQCQVEQVSFDDRIGTANNINRWVEEQTNGLIKDIISERLINPRTVLFLFNTIYFKANWAAKFNPRTNINTFYGLNDQEYQIQFMSSSDYRKYTYDSFLHADVLQIDYENGVGYKFWIIQPTVETTLTTVLNMLSWNAIQNIANNLKVSHYKFSVPKFEIESEMDAKDALKSYGVEHLFQEYQLFMASGPLLKVDAAGQKTKIIVNTDGTEAATTSYSRATSRMMRQNFFFNRAFIFLILTESTNEPIFVGHYVRP